MSANASDLLDSVKVVTSLDEALEDTNFVVATSSRMRRVPWPCESLEEASPKIIKHSETSKIAIMFGREDRGLTNDELQDQICIYQYQLILIPSIKFSNVSPGGMLSAVFG